ncbi:uncharacterized protein LOC62_06G008435 [Vanrija pseudolonga]|uniref:Uncharacterized protein n=1 Tax=Vanrija pseudolonga TaxID=143232 RepID=A0AAF0YDV9_9TREE|nr:hypothetical protein LOC62_06G008435 [Vanrija pseudolonga]
MPAIVKNTINLFRTSRKADPVEPPDNPLVFPSTPSPPPLPPAPALPPPVRRYSPNNEQLAGAGGVPPRATAPPTVPMPPKPKSRHSSAPVPNYAAHGGGAADMTPTTQAKVLPWVNGLRNQVYEEPMGLVGPYPAPPTRPQSLYSPPPLPTVPKPPSALTFAALVEEQDPVPPSPRRHEDDVLSRGAGLAADVDKAMLAFPSLRDFPSTPGTFGGTPAEGSFKQDTAPLMKASKPAKSKEKKTTPRQSHSMPPAQTLEKQPFALPPAVVLPRIHKQRREFPFSIEEAFVTQEREKARADTFAQLVANQGKPAVAPIAKLGSPFRPDTFETLPTSTDTSFGHIAHENGRPIASAANTPHAPKRTEDRATSMPPAAVPQDPPFIFHTTSPAMYMDSLRFAAAPVQVAKINEVRVDQQSAYVETVMDEEATPRVRQKSERAIVVNPPSRDEPQAATQQTPKAGHSHSRQQSAPLSYFSDVLSEATFKAPSYAPTTTTNVHNMVEQSSFHDETLCQLLDAARLNLVGEQAKKALMRAARARVIELKDIKEHGEQSPPPIHMTSPLAIKKKKHHRAKTEEATIPHSMVEAAAKLSKQASKAEIVAKMPSVPQSAPAPEPSTPSDRSTRQQSPPPWANEIIQRLEAFDARFSELGKRSTDKGPLEAAVIFGTGPSAEDMEVLKNALNNISAYPAYSYAGETIDFGYAKPGSIHTVAPTVSPESDPRGAASNVNLNEATPKQRDTMTWGSEVDMPDQTPPLMPRPPRIEIQPPTTLASKTTTGTTHSPTNNASGSPSEASNARTFGVRTPEKPPPVPSKSVGPKSVSNTEPRPSSSAGMVSMSTPPVKPADLFSMTMSPTTTYRSHAFHGSVDMPQMKSTVPAAPWDLVTQRLYGWALVWEEDSFVRALERMALGFQVKFPLAVYTMLIFKRNIHRRLNMTPPLVCDKLFVPPNIADGINKSVHSKQFSDAKLILESLWQPFRFKEPPRVIVSLMKHGGRENTWLAARHDLTTGKLLVYVVGPGLQDAPEGKDLDNRVYMWWLAIRQAWPQYSIPHTDTPDRLPYTIKTVPIPVAQKESSSLKAMVISRNFLLGMRPETTDDVTRLREAVWGEVRRLLLKKQQGKLHVHSMDAGATDTISNL